MFVRVFLGFLVTLAAFAAGFALARRPLLPREIHAKVLALGHAVAHGGAQRMRAEVQRFRRRSSRIDVASPAGVASSQDAVASSASMSAAIVLEAGGASAGQAAETSRAAAEVSGCVAEVSGCVAEVSGCVAEVSGCAAEVIASAEASRVPAPLVPLATLGGVPSVRFDPIAARGTQSTELDHHSPEWRAEMAAVGARFVASDVSAIVFVHGTFTGTDPFSAYSLVERALPSPIGPQIARSLRQKTHRYLRRVLGDLGNFGTSYVRLFEEAIRPRGARIPCTDFVWSSENHHVGRLEGALKLVRVLATHAELGELDHEGRPRRLLVMGHSHAGQLFALVTQLLARSMATEAILDIARARDLDVASLETDLATLTGTSVGARKTAIDFVTFGAPNRYAWAKVSDVRALHVIAVPPTGSRGAMEGDWIRRLGVEGSDFPPLAGEDRRVNAALEGSLGHAGFAPTRVAAALRAGVGLPANGEVAFVEYGERGLLSTGLGHGTYTRLDGMLFHARLVADRLYPEAVRAEVGAGEPAPLAARARSALRAIGPASKPARR